MLKSNSIVSVVAGAKQMTCEEGEPKMVFQIELVPKEESMMAFKALGYTSAVKNFYNYLNDWGVGQAPPSLKTVDNLCFSNEEAIKGETELTKKVEFMMSQLVDIREIFESAQGESKEHFKMI